MMREHELSCNTLSNDCDRLRVCQEKLYLGRLLLLWPYTANLNHLSYFIPGGQTEGLEQLSEPEGFKKKKKKRLWLGGFICNTRVGHNAEPLMNEYLRKIICDKVTCSSRIIWLWETAVTAASVSLNCPMCWWSSLHSGRWSQVLYPFQRQRCVTSSRSSVSGCPPTMGD